MTQSSSRLAYDDCYDLMDRAMADEKGIRFRAKSLDDAMMRRGRLNGARRIDRLDNKDMYPRGDPLHGRSAYDQLSFLIREIEGDWWVICYKRSSEELEIIDLSSDDVDWDQPSERPDLETVLNLRRPG